MYCARGAGGSVEVPGPPQTQTDCRGCDAQAFGAVLRCAENRQTFRCGDSDGRLSHIKELIAWRASKTLSCQRETLHSQQLRSIKKSIDSDHGIYRKPKTANRDRESADSRCR